ncbi:MAG TPA: sulfite oxidase-like oxidoreductase [Patescibacteria group bacterium]|nr:sulfite oxidase-like oxidoreductase [Patescibacteria group bacterium]
MDDANPPLLGALKEKLIAAKQCWARDGRRLTGAPDIDHHRRLPPGQREVTDWPVLDLGVVPNLSTRDWSFSVGGMVERTVEWNWDQFLAQPQLSLRVDMHCVTAWSRYDNDFVGVPALRLLDVVRPLPEARFLMLHGYDGYTTNLPLADFADDDVVLAHSWQGRPISREHGGPMRLILPKLYLWKSAKWLRHITFSDRDDPGYWEQRGYHRRGDPWKEERYD